MYYVFLAFFAKIYLKRTRPLIIGITGSVGKTSCRMIVTQVLQQLVPEKKIYTSPKNFNSEVGLILSIFQIESYEPTATYILSIFFKIFFQTLFPKKFPDILVLEYGIDHLHDMKYLTAISKADIAIFTKLDAVHGANFRSVEAIGDEKFLLMKGARKRVYLNGLDEYCRTHAENLGAEVKFYNQGSLESEKMVYEKEDEKTYLKASWDFWEVKTNLLGQESIAYILLALDIASFISGKSFNGETHTFELELQPGRFSLFSENENIYIDSTYNAAPESMRAMIQNTKILKETIAPTYKLGFVIGDMRELGENSIEAHTSLIPLLLEADFIFTVWSEMKSYVASGLLKNNYKGLLKSFTSSREAGKELAPYLESIGNKSIILFKGSQNTIFTEEALKQVLVNEDFKKELVRQANDWKRKKEEFFSK